MIAIYNLEPKYFNLALEKVRKYYEDLGVTVDDYKPLWHAKYDKIYCSSIFMWTDKSTVTPDMICGGTGFDLTTTLPPEIEAVKVRKNKGFTTRGCIRKCPFCVVPEKEGRIRVVGDICDLWDGKAKEIILYDNNILALPEHFEHICAQLRILKLTVDFNQGLDHRLLTQKKIALLKSIKHKELRFAFDDIVYEDSVIKTIRLLRKNRINRCFWYVLVGFNSTTREDLERLNILRKHNQNAYVQRYNMNTDKKYIPLARWANQHHIFQGMTWEQFIARKENARYRRYYD